MKLSIIVLCLLEKLYFFKNVQNKYYIYIINRPTYIGDSVGF